MGSKIFIPATKPEDWKSLLAKPEKHWRKGYSARSLAYCWQEAEGFPECVKKAFSQSNISILHNIELLLAIPEYQVSLPGGSRPSQNDIFVRWKPIEEQPIGWEPDINDGVRLNIRPFMAQDIPGGRKGAGILRWKPNIKWNKDRGKDVASAPWFPLFKGDRINDHHLSLEEKRNARAEARGRKGELANWRKGEGVI